VYFHLILTDNCNLCCSYCRAKAFESGESGCEEPEPIEVDPDLPVELAVDLPLLYEFLKKDPSATLTFYGGEPLLRADLIDRIVREAPVQRFMIQTNGLLLDRLDPEIVNRFSTLLISVDGAPALTDANRGAGTYRRVMENVNRVLAGGYKNELIARMTVTEDTDIIEAVRWLAGNPDHFFTSIHWQLDANFSGDYSRRRFAEWVRTSYNPGIRELITGWVDLMEKEGVVQRWYPFLDPVDDLLSGSKSRLRCGSGYMNYSIMTDGHIAPCPVMAGMSRYYVGHVADADPLALRTVDVGGECSDCRIRDFCGGRCLYSNITRPWRTDERKLVCETIENLHEALTGAVPRIQELIRTGIISRSDFAHEKFNGCEIIP
jgi:putative peptide-modifying radical SAM enzyme